MADDAELGAFATMTTVTANDWTPEMLAAVRRGPLAAPTEDEMTEYLRLVRYKGDRVAISSAAAKVRNGTYLPFGDHNARKKYRNERGDSETQVLRQESFSDCRSTFESGWA